MTEEKIKQAMAICAREIREVPSCLSCCHYAECVRKGAPASELGRFVSWLALEALPPIEATLNSFCAAAIRLKASNANDAQTRKGAYAVVSGYNAKRRVLFRVLLRGRESADELAEKVLKAYAYRKGK